MSLMQRLFGNKGETRDADPSWAAVAHNISLGTNVGAKQAEQSPAVLACVNAISQAVGALPATVFKRTNDGSEESPNHPLAQLIRNGPNDSQTWPDLIEWLMAQTLLHGNGLIEIVAGREGQVVALIPTPWSNVAVQIVNGRLVYGVAGLDGRSRRLLAHEVLHLRDRTDDGLIGKPRLSRAAPAIIMALQMQDFGNLFYKNSARPGGILSTEGTISPETADRLKAHWQEGFGGENNGRVAVLGDGLDFKKMSFTPEESETLATRRFVTEEICRIFNVPPPIVQAYENNTFTNAAQAARWFATNCLMPWISKLEHQIMRSVFSEADRQDHTITFDLSGFLRGDAETRWQTHKVAIDGGILTVDEVRDIEGYAPLRDGDKLTQA